MTKDLRQRLKAAFEIHQSGRLDEARGLYREILSLEPHDADTNNLMGLLCIQSGAPVKAARHLKRALRADPENAQAHYNLGVAYKDMERMPEAAEAFATAALLDDDKIEYQSSLGNALRLSGRAAEAVRILERAVRKASGNPGLRLNLALAQNDLGASLIRKRAPQQAVRHFLRAIELEPAHARAHMNLGLTLEQLGQLAGAERSYRAAIKAQPGFADAHFQLAHLRTHRSSQTEISAMKSLLKKPGTGRKDRIRLAYGLGFAMESAERYPEAFSYMTRAHRLQADRSSFDIGTACRRFEKIQHIFSKERLAAAEANGPPDERPVFIVGMPRSGTTLAEQVLASHPSVHGTGETMALARAARLASPRQPFPGGLDQLSEDQLNAAAEAYLLELTADAGGALRLTDTTPMNFLYAGFAAMLLPGARFVFCTRDPMDNCLSIYRQMLTGANEFTHTLENLGAYYRLHLDLLNHWESALPGRVFRLQYEDLIRDNENQVGKLLEFCGLPFDDRCLKFYESDRVVRSPSAAQVRQPVYDTSIGAWKRYEKELTPLMDALRGTS
ncbi:MAG: sulfotransferase [Xanthomonadales bacterium]|jgi:Flp pilus assembly protein TadD|nr:sulfotransferase [Xanthomonadales bacterium]